MLETLITAATNTIATSAKPTAVAGLTTGVLIPLVGGGAIGFACGYALKKIMKLAFIGLGLLALLLGYLSYQKWISVNWTMVENQTSTMMSQAAHEAYVATQQMGHEIPIGLGAIGFLPGLALGLARG